MIDAPPLLIRTASACQGVRTPPPPPPRITSHKLTAPPAFCIGPETYHSFSYRARKVRIGTYVSRISMHHYTGTMYKTSTSPTQSRSPINRSPRQTSWPSARLSCTWCVLQLLAFSIVMKTYYSGDQWGKKKKNRSLNCAISVYLASNGSIRLSKPIILVGYRTYMYWP